MSRLLKFSLESLKENSINFMKVRLIKEITSIYFPHTGKKEVKP
tara:strand:- start:426 stop:557 length:132 start_codon:yes stop_codon:yes gene_type:complete